jgi:hypothetical protein
MKTVRQGSVSIPLLARLDLVPVLAAAVRGGRRDPVGGHEGIVAITESDRILGTLWGVLASIHRVNRVAFGRVDAKGAP